MCAQSSLSSSEASKSLLARAWAKIPPIGQHITATNQVLQSLSVYQLSSFFNYYRLSLFVCLSQGKLIIREHEFCFSEHFLKYFESGNLESLYSIDSLDPTAVTRVKKLFNVLLTAEQFLLKLEKHGSINMVSVYDFFLQLKHDAHVLAKMVLELTSDCFNLFDQDANTVLMLSSNLFSTIQMLITGVQDNQNLTDIYQSLERYGRAIYESAKTIDMNKLIAGSLGHCISLMGPDETNGESIGVLLTNLPAFFNQLSEKIELFSKEIAYKHSRDKSVVIQDFQQQTKLILDQLGNLSLNGISFSYNLYNLLNNCFKLWDYKNTLQSRLGLLQESSQHFIIEHLRALKYQFLLPIFNVADDIELDFKLRPGEVTEKLAPHIERFYWWLVYITRDNIEFSGADEELLFLFDERWNQTRLNRTYQIYADRKLELFRLNELYNHFQRVKQTFNSLGVDEYWKTELPLFLPVVKKADDEWYVKLLDNPENFKNQLVQDKLDAQLLQECASLQLMLLDIEEMLAFVQFKEGRLTHFIEWPIEWPVNLEVIASRFCSDYLLISQAGKYYFYDGNKSEISSLSPSQLKSFSEDRYLSNLLFRCNSEQQKSLELAIGRKIFKIHKDTQLEFVETALQSVLHSLDKSEKFLKNIFLQKYRLEKAALMAQAFFNFISTRAQDFPEHALIQEWRDDLIIQKAYFSFILDDEQKLLLSLIQKKHPPLMRELQQCVAQEQANIFAGIHRQKMQLRRQEKLVGVEYIKNSFDYTKARFKPECLSVSRAGYFLNSTRGSDLTKLIKSNLESWFEMYHFEAKKFMCKREDGYYSALLDDYKVILSFPKQVVDGMIIYNSLTMFEGLFTKLEELKKSEFADDMANLFTKIYLVVDYVSLQNYVMTQFRYTYHWQLFKKFYAQFWDIYDINKLPIGAYEPLESDKMQITSPMSMLEKWIYWFLNSPELIRLKVGEKAIFNKSDNLEIIKSIRDILGNIQSYFWLAFKLGFYDIYSLVSQLKNRLSNFNSVIYKLIATNLYTLKTDLFAEFMMAIDDLEVDIGVQPEYFSDKVAQIIDVFFQYFLCSLNLDLVKFSQLMISNDLKQLRIKHDEDMLDKTRIQEEKLQQISQRLIAFLNLWERVEQQRQVSSYPDVIVDALKPELMDIVNILIDYQSNRIYPTRSELMSESERFWDDKIDGWLCHSEHRGKILSKDYLNLIRSISQFMIGLVNTERLKFKLFQSKKQHLIDMPERDMKKDLRQFTTIQFDNYFRHLKNSRQHVCLKMNHLYVGQLEEFFASRKDGLVDKIYNQLLREYHRQQTIQISVPLNESHLAKQYLKEFQELIRVFDATYNHHYLYLESVLEIIEKFERYLGLVKISLMQGKGDWFENDKTIDTKLEQLKAVSQLILNSEGSLEQRVILVQKVLKESKDFKSIILNHAELSGSGILQYLLKLWQWLMLILIKFGFYEPEHHKVFNLLSDIKPSSVPIEFDKGRFNIFNGLNVDKQPSPDLVNGVNVCVA